MNQRKVIAFLIASSFLLFVGIVGFVRAITVENDFDFGNARDIFGVRSLSVGTSTVEAGKLKIGTGGIRFADGTLQTTAGVGGSGGVSGGAGEIAYFNTTSSLTSNPNLFWDTTNNRLNASSGIVVGNTSAAQAGAIRWNGTNFEGYNGSAWVQLDLQAAPEGGGWIQDSSLNRVYLQNSGRRVGIGTSTPDTKLNVFDSVDSLVKLERDGAASPTVFRLGTDSAFVLQNQGVDSIHVAGNMVTVNGFKMPTGASAGFILTSDGAGVAAWQAEVGDIEGVTAGNGLTGGGTSGAVTLSIDTGASLTWTAVQTFDAVGTDIVADKIDAGTVDPVYNIGGVRYATYVASVAGGVKEEYVSRAELVPISNFEIQNSKFEFSEPTYEYVIDFNNLEKGSDLWLFYQATDFGEDMQYLQVFVTPGFDGRVWYEKDPMNKTVTIFGRPSCQMSDVRCQVSSLEASLRLTANRFDWREWTNRASGDGKHGFVLEEK